MRGHQALIAMRHKRRKPAIVFIDTDAGPSALPTWAQWQSVDESLCDIDVESGESLLRIDWRPLVGLVVQVSGTDSDRVQAVEGLVKEAGAKRVIAVCLRQVGQGEWISFVVDWMHDTAGQFGEERHADAA